MLILTRRIGEALMIGDNVHLKVLDVQGTQVKIGVDAPKDIGVHRQEIYQRIQNEKRHAKDKGATQHASAPMEETTPPTHATPPTRLTHYSSTGYQKTTTKATTVIVKKAIYKAPQ